MKRYCLCMTLLMPLLTFAKTIQVPTDQAKIQTAINVADPGDTVLVAPGTYLENIDFKGKGITVASHFLTTGDTSYISQTIIDGNQNHNTVLFQNSEDTTAVLLGFTITNAMDGGIYITNASPRLSHLSILRNTGGGIHCRGRNSRLIVNKSVISDNFGGGLYFSGSYINISETKVNKNHAGIRGGGIYLFLNDSTIAKLTDVVVEDNWVDQWGRPEGGGGIYVRRGKELFFSNVVIRNNRAVKGGGVYLDRVQRLVFDSENRCSIYNNSGFPGADIYSELSETVDVVLDTFTVSNPSSSIAYPLEAFTFDIRHALSSLSKSDLYVSPTGNDLNDGLTKNTPMKTIGHALSRVYVDSLIKPTIHLANGIYSPSTNGEKFPLNIFASIVGEDEANTILDAEQQGRLIQCSNANGIRIAKLTIRNGDAEAGGGIYCEESDILLDSLTIADCSASEGAGIYLTGKSNPILSNLTFRNNYAYFSGSGIHCEGVEPIIDRVAVTGNENWADGIFAFYDSRPTLSNIAIVQNDISYNPPPNMPASGMSFGNSVASVINCIFAGNDGAAGITSYNSSIVSVLNCTIANNVNYGLDSGIFCEASTNMAIVNTILWNHNPREITFHPSSAEKAIEITIAHSIVRGGMDGIYEKDKIKINWLDGNLDLEPLFVDTTNYDYHLRSDSPGIDAGTPLFVWNGDTLLNLTPEDYEGLAPDIGAYGINQSVQVYPVTSISTENKIGPAQFSLLQNYPNPFNARTTIRYELPKRSTVTLEIFDLQGRKMAALADRHQEKGVHEINWNADGFASGVYFYRIQAVEFKDVRKLVLVK